jgi:XTP/dITP diphosphohydrolase
MKLVLATGNPGKREEFRALLSGSGLELYSPEELGLELKVPETGSTYLENALIKARAYAQASGLWALADDTGLEVDTLDNAPGLYSARYAPGENATDADRRRTLLNNLAEHDRPWKARFVCTAAAAGPTGNTLHARGVCPGEIIPQERGDQGFGYDAVFLLPEAGKTMAELDPAEKNQLSHRARAVGKLLPGLLEKLA